MTQKTDKIGKLFLVDPNPPGTSKIPEEDLFIYVSLVARSKNRGVGESLDPEEGRIRFISTEIPLEESTANRGGKSYATTDYTNIGGKAAQDSGGSLEGFGITNISVKYGASLVPQVDISFVDLRGSALFDVLQEEGRNMAYGAFFQLPYPIFELKLKGYFGNTITYCLHMLSWTSKFDSSTGNFNIDGRFVGFQQAFLADMSLGNVIGTVNTTKGRANLKKLKIKNSLNPKQPEETPPLDRFLITLSELPIRFIKIKDQDKDYQKFRKLTNLQAKLKNILDLIGFPMKKITEGLDPNMEFYKQPNDPTQTLTRGFDEDDLANNIDYISIRDWIIIKKGVSAYPSVFFGQFFKTLHSLIDDYNIFIETNKNELLINDSDIKFDSYGDDYLWSGLVELSTEADGPGGYYDFINDNIPASFKITSTATKFGDIKTSMTYPATKKSLYSLLTSPERNKTFKPEIQFDGKFWGKTQREFTKSESVLVFVYDFSKMKQIVNTIWNLVKKERKIREEEINKELNKKLSKDIGFNPNIRYVFSILCNNVQAMLATQFEVAEEAHRKRKSRNIELKNYSSMSDLPRDEDGNAISYPWPTLHVNNPNEGTVEVKYIGNDDFFPNLTKENFPEIKFIEEFLQNYITKKAQVISANKISAKVSTGGRDTDNWYPINPIDFRDNPYFDLITESNIESIEKKIGEILALRAIVSINYSNYKETSIKHSLEDLGKLDGINAEKTLFNKDGSNLKLVKLISKSNFTPLHIINKLVNNRYLLVVGNNEYRLKESSGVNATNHEISGKLISGYRNKDADFILIGDIDQVNEIWNNTSSLWPAITKDKNGNARNSFKRLHENTPPENKSNPAFYKQKYNNVQNLCYKVWADDINTKLVADQPDPKKLRGFSITDISLIDGGPNISNEKKNTSSGGLTLGSRKYINIIRSKNVNSSPGNTLQWGVPPQLTENLLYTQQLGKNQKALLLLNTLPFNTFDNTILDLILDPKYNYGKIILLPKYYLYWLGGTLWRYLEYQVSGSDPIKWGPHNVTLQFNVTPFEFMYTIGNQAGYKPYTDKNSLIGDSLLSLPSNIKEKFINYFLRWVDSETADNDNFDNFELTVKEYSNSADIKGAKEPADTLRRWFAQYEKIVIAAPDIFDPTTFKSGLKISHSELVSYITAFQTAYKSQNVLYQKTKEAQKVKTKDIVKDPDLQLSVYNYFKNIYNKWIAGTQNKDDLVYNACGASGRDLIKYFHFINRSWGDIGDKAVINLNSLTSLSDNMDSNMYFLMSKILRDNNFLFQILPNYVNFKDPEDVKAMFTPQFTLEETKDDNSGPSYICIYCGGNSESVDIVQENRTYAYPNDSFLIFNNPAEEFIKVEEPFEAIYQADKESKNKKEAVSMVAFRVAFGTENQSIFKDISLDQSEYRETAEYFSTLSELIDNRGGTQRVFKGTDLLKVFKTRAYKCGVESLGCMSIQPLMYFQLDNVPFFNGTYLITDVNHTITANHMSTNFSGLRQSTYVTPLVDTYTTFLDLDFNEISEEPPEFKNLTDKDSDILFIGVTEELSKLPFNPKLITKSTLLELKVSEEVADELFSVPDATTSGLLGGTGKETYFELVLKSFGIKRNDQAVFFISQMLYNSNNMSSMSNSRIAKGTAVKIGTVTQTWTNTDIKYMPTLSDALSATYGPAGTGYITDINDNDQWIKLYRFRERGYLNLIGKSNYTTAVADPNVIKYIKAIFPLPSPNLINDPDTISDSPLLSFVIAAHVFTTKTLKKSKLPQTYKDDNTQWLNKTCNQMSGEGTNIGGSCTRYQFVTQVLKDSKIGDAPVAFPPFRDVLQQTSLLSYTNVGEI